MVHRAEACVLLQRAVSHDITMLGPPHRSVVLTPATSRFTKIELSAKSRRRLWTLRWVFAQAAQKKARQFGDLL